MFKFIKILMLSMIMLSPVICAQTFPEVKKQIQSEKDNIKKLNLLTEAKKKISLYTPHQQAEYWFLLGKSFENQRKMNNAMEAYTKAIELYTKYKLPPSSLLVDLHIDRARSAVTVDYYNTSDCKDREHALLLARGLAQPNLIAKSIAYYAKCLQSEEHGISKSLKLFDEAFNIAKKEQLSSNIKQVIYNQAATLSFRSLFYDKAYEYNMLAYELSIGTDDIGSVYAATVNAVHYSIALADIELAKQHLSELALFSEKYLEFNDAKLKYYYLSAKVAQLEQNWLLSISFLEAGIKEITMGQNVSYIQATYELLSISYFRAGEIEKSYQTLTAVEKMYPNKQPIKKEVFLIKGVMIKGSVEVAQAAFKLIDEEKQSKNNFVKNSATQAAQTFDENLKQLDNILLEQRLIIVSVSTLFIVMVLIGYSYLQIQRKKLAVKEHHLMDELLTKKNQLLADVCHELGTPLTVLKLQVESLKDDLEEDVQVTYRAIDKKLDDIQHLIDDIHQLAQSDVGALQLNIEPFELNKTLDHWQGELTQFVNKNKLAFEITRDLPISLMVNFDRDRIKQVFINLLSNSIKYTDKPGQVKLTATTKRRTLLLSIEDSSPSVSDSDLTNIFERLYRVESSRSRDTGGSGLGLAICKSLIEEHNGKIFAEQSHLGGLKITLELPC